MNNRSTVELVRAGLARRRRSEKLFRFTGIAALSVGVLFLIFLFVTIIGNGWSAFRHAQLRLPIEITESIIDPRGERDEAALRRADYQRLIRNALSDYFPDVSGRSQRRALNGLISTGAAYQLRDLVTQQPELIGESIDIWLAADDEVAERADDRARVGVQEDEPRRRDVQAEAEERGDQQQAMHGGDPQRPQPLDHAKAKGLQPARNFLRVRLRRAL